MNISSDRAWRGHPPRLAHRGGGSGANEAATQRQINPGETLQSKGVTVCCQKRENKLERKSTRTPERLARSEDLGVLL